jgi:hypothetical protein
MQEIDIFASELFEEAKRFLEKSKEPNGDEGQKAFLHAALLLGMSSLEAHINAICGEMSERQGLDLLDISILTEKEINFDRGQYKLAGKLKIYNLTDRILYLCRRFAIAGKNLDTNSEWWGKLHQGIDLRNSLVHPKAKRDVTYEQVESAFDGILGVLEALYLILYDQHFPALGRRFDSKMSF